MKALFDKYEHTFTEGRLKWAFPVYESIYTFLYTPGLVTRNAAHVRDAAVLKRIMIAVWVACFTALLWGMYQVGAQANSAIAAGAAPVGGWRGALVTLLGGYDPNSAWHALWHGACWFLPIYAVTFAVGIAWEALFASVRGHEINEGFFVTSVLFALILPPTTPLWQVALGISFGVVFGKEIFGGVGKNFLNPALVGRAFLFFAYPAQMSGDAVWVAVLLGGGALLLTRVASWRIVAGVLIGAALTVGLFNVLGSATNPMFGVPMHWHLALGGFAFGLMFMATDPVSASMTTVGKWWYGALIGVMVMLVRVVNPAFPEGMMLAILFANVFAPTIDSVVVAANVRRRRRRAG